MIMLERWSVQWRENGDVTEVDGIMEGAWSCYRGGHFNGGKKVVTELASVGRENGYVTEVASLMGGRMVMLQNWPV